MNKLKFFVKQNYIWISITLSFLLVICLTLFVDDLFQTGHADVVGGVSANWQNLLNILKAPGILLTDAIHLGGLQATILNMFLTVGLNLIIVKAFKVKIEGPVIAGLFTIAGFTFFGKNVWNALPIYLGVWAYAKFKKQDIKSLMAVLLLSSGISPVTSYLLFGNGMIEAVPSLALRIGIMLVGGFVVGYLIPIVYFQAIKLHNGMNLYNTGFTMGLIAVFVHGALRSFGVNVEFVGVPIYNETYGLVYRDYTWQLFMLFAVFFIALIVIALIVEKHAIKKANQDIGVMKSLMGNYKKITSSTGALVSNFPKAAGFGATIFNMGLMGLIVLVLFVPLIFISPLLFPHIAGLTYLPFIATLGGAILTVVGFAAFGKHPFNALPIIAGTTIGFLVLAWINTDYSLINPGGFDLNVHVLVSGIFFATCLSPMSKEYGWIQGIITGFVHMLIVMIARSFQGGFDLYNNGFAAGFVAGFLVPVFDSFRKSDVEPIINLPKPSEVSSLKRIDCLRISKIIGEISNYFLLNHEVSVSLNVEYQSEKTLISINTPMIDQTIFDTVKERLSAPRDIHADVNYTILGEGEGHAGLGLVAALTDEKIIEEVEGNISISLITYT